MDNLRKIVAVLSLSAIVLAFAAPALAQMQGMPTMMPGGMNGGVTMPVEQSDKDLMGALTDTKDTSMAASLMKMAGMEGMAKPAGTYTIFVASDPALKATSPDVMNKMMKTVRDRQTAIDFVKGHMVSGMVIPDEMTDGKTLNMMNGKTLMVKKMNGKTMVDDATIVKAVKANNGVVYVMDKIPSSFMAMVG
jgi:uncharacterized surface protein with fasciclin (FAS1) repeats